MGRGSRIGTRAFVFLLLLAPGLFAPGARAAAPVVQPTPGPANSIGSAANGCLAGGEAMPLSGPGWQVLRPADRRYFGNPAMIRFLEDEAALNRAIGTLQIGDISQPRGGPMPSDHASHEIGLDVDVSFTIERGPVSRTHRDKPVFNSVVRPDGSLDPKYWGQTQARVLRHFAGDPRVERIFVNPAIKRALCKSEPDTAWLHKIRSWWGHEAHFHTRLNCPPGQTECHTSAPVPPGDGCGAELDWWFTPEAASPPRSTGPKPPLPAACTPILNGKG